MNKIKFAKVIFVITVFLLSSCSNNVANTTSTVENPNSGYPVLQEVEPNGYPSPQKGYENLSDLIPPASAHNPIEGFASISGLIYVPGSKFIVKDTLIYLVMAEGENKDMMPGILIGSGLKTRGDIISRTDDNGNFFIDNIPPGNYFLIISFTNNIIIASNSSEDLEPRLFKFLKNESYPLGLIVSPGS